MQKITIIFKKSIYKVLEKLRIEGIMRKIIIFSSIVIYSKFIFLY